VNKQTTEQPPQLAKLVPTFAGRRWSAQWIPTTVSLGFINQSCDCFFQVALSYLPEAEWILSRTHYFTENIVALGIKSGTTGSVVRDSDHQTTEAVMVPVNHFIYISDL
jgi:hypothetical protein